MVAFQSFLTYSTWTGLQELVKKLFCELSEFFSGGAEGIRTPDLLRAREALSQLSYSPGMG